MQYEKRRINTTHHPQSGDLLWQTYHSMRYPVEMILDLLSAGMTQEEILADYPALEVADIQACLALTPKLLYMRIFVFR